MELDWHKICPECKVVIYYSTKYTLKRSIEKNSKCQSCSKIGNTCAKGIFGRKHSEETKLKLRKPKSEATRKKMRKPKSATTKQKMRLSKLGSQNPKWNPNITDSERDDKRDTLEYKTFIKEVLKENDYTCDITGKRGGKMVVHHLLSYARHKTLRMDRTNVVVITQQLHKQFHSLYGYKNFTPNDYEYFKEQIRNSLV